MKVESLDQLEKAYIVWRKRKRHVREAVPDELIDRTHHAAAHFGGTAVSRAIKIDWQRLSKKRPLKKPAIPSFSRLELPPLPSLDRPLAELETPAGMKLHEGVCNAHAMLKFRDIKDKFPEEYAVAGPVYKQVFANDDIAKGQGLTPTERMLFHREKSLPLMVSLKVMCEGKITSRLVEPRSPLWHPLTFIINQWPRLTQFCKMPGIPLDTNLVEQSLIIPVRYLAASFNYQTAAGAEVGDRYMSLVITAIDNEIEPVAYLTYCLENHEDLAKRPEFYLPWSYRDRMAEIEK